MRHFTTAATQGKQSQGVREVVSGVIGVEVVDPVMQLFHDVVSMEVGGIVAGGMQSHSIVA